METDWTKLHGDGLLMVRAGVGGEGSVPAIAGAESAAAFPQRARVRGLQRVERGPE